MIDRLVRRALAEAERRGGALRGVHVRLGALATIDEPRLRADFAHLVADHLGLDVALHVERAPDRPSGVEIVGLDLAAPVIRRELVIRGIVQGVGFRPTVARVADALALAGSVHNDGAGVVIAIEGPADRVGAFPDQLRQALPRAARIDQLEIVDREPVGLRGFTIASSADGPARLAIPPDLATCADCLAEIGDPSARRFAYPFTNCTACGPRFTIVASLPYDRPRTSMAGFPMCEGCAAEYADPRDRRHHAQPIACPRCGPRLVLRDPDVVATGPDALAAARAALRAGKIVACKGLGGWQLLVDATDESAVQRLRERKRREAKPFAVLVADLDAARRLADIDAIEADALTSPAAPIVLLRRRDGLARSVAPELARIGLMLPTTPLHHLLVRDLGFPVVCTSGNVHDQPIVVGDDDAIARLAGIADLWLGHDRPILRRCDDSVVHVVDGAARALRLGRGLGPLALPIADGPAILAVGGHLKAAPALAIGDRLVAWPHVGDLGTLDAREALTDAIGAMTAFLGARPVAVAHDAHPDAGATHVAERLGLPRVPVWHHHAHVAAVLAEHGEREALGFAWDGVGLGPDGALWGGEVLRVGPAGVVRVGHLAPFPLPGGDRAARDGRRALAGVLVAAGSPVPDDLSAFAAVARHAPVTTSVGRLFDAVAALLGICARSRFEGEAAARLEALADRPDVDPYPFRLDGPVLDWRPMIPAIRAERDAAVAASRFHRTLVALIVAVVARERAPVVALCGGCFQNVRLVGAVASALRDRGVRVRIPAQLPPGDGGLAVGQAWIARQQRVVG